MHRQDFSEPYLFRALKLICWQRVRSTQPRSQDLYPGQGKGPGNEVEICNGASRVRAAVVCDAAGVTPVGGSGGMFPQKILKNGSS